jgi:predicted dehydrogenase
MSLKAAVIGAGYASDFHLSALSRNPKSELVAVCDTDTSRVEQAANDYDTSAYEDIDELIETERPDLIHIVTPVQTHLPLAKKSIEAGIPILVEKPITTDIGELEELQDLSQSHDVPISVVRNQLFYPVMRAARDSVRSVGPITGVDIIFTGQPSPDDVERDSWVFDLPGGEFEEGLPHPIYLTLQLGGYPQDGGDIKALTTLTGKYDRDFTYDNAQVQYVSEDEALCNIKLISSSFPHQRLALVCGEHGSVIVDLVGKTVIEVDQEFKGSPVGIIKQNLNFALDHAQSSIGNVARFGRSFSEVKLDNHSENSNDGHYYQINETLDALQNGEEPPVGLEDTRWTLEIMEQIREAA